MADALRYVVLHHTQIPEPHFDLMYEPSPGAALVTWRLLDWPITAQITAERLPDHRAAYLTYEGPISGNRGYVTRVQAGTCKVDHSREDQIVLELHSPPAHITIENIGPDQWLARA